MKNLEKVVEKFDKKVDHQFEEVNVKLESDIPDQFEQLQQQMRAQERYMYKVEKELRQLESR